jgi:hypothetical protein
MYDDSFVEDLNETARIRMFEEMIDALPTWLRQRVNRLSLLDLERIEKRIHRELFLAILN